MEPRSQTQQLSDQKAPPLEFNFNDEPSDELTDLTADQILEKLMRGNQRYVDHKLRHPHQTGLQMEEIAAGQHPIAIILGCADSRVPPEIIFDQGLGDLFVIRVAGNILDDAILGSIEYATEEFGVRLVMVLGHERCGAIAAAVQGGEALGHISTLVSAILPALQNLEPFPADPIEAAVRANVQWVVQQLRRSEPILTSLLEVGKLKVVGARYDLDDGEVQIIA